MKQSTYELLLPLKLKWETFKLTGTTRIDLKERKIINAAHKDLKGNEPEWCCTESVGINFNAVMRPFDMYEKENISNPVKVVVEQKIVKRRK